MSLIVPGTSRDDPSGHAAAQAAHEAGAVEPPEPRPTCQVRISFSVHAEAERAQALAELVTAWLLAQTDVVQPIAASVTAWP